MDVRELFIHLLESKSETPDDGGLMDYLSAFLDDFEALRFDAHGVKNLFLTKTFGSGGAHLCFAGHVDVVPAGEGWLSDPYSATIKVVDEQERVFARGAQDMKSGVSAFVHAVKSAKHFNGRLSILLTSDEEGDAKYGTQVVLEALKARNLLPEFCVVAEPTCETVMGDAIKIGRRGSINAELIIKGKQGHAAYPQKAINPVNLLAPILPKIAGHLLDDGDESFAPSQMVVTDIRGGMEVTNVTPGSVKLMFNVRNTTQTDVSKIEAYIAELFTGIDYSLTLKQSAFPFKTNANSYVVTALEQAITAVCELSTKHSTAGGTSDARFIAAYGIDVIEFGVKNDSIHAPNENTTFLEVEQLRDVFLHLIENF